ncbi:hypothetical protein OD350_03790 [Clostridium beijerinckii]|uniref:hypothetical protein n=1 Tax=Clostridium beijerinckii TaxID=1520 RepID=UPI00222776D3|nr:hypothetical protein [Clostridium beijerinckii]UYZ36804.1 hypothetical protein OD350_03790 [Clostridium beijerinckii]
MGWKISDKPTVDPKDTDLVLIEQDGNTRNTTWAKLKALFLGTATLATTDQTIKGAINEVKASTDANATSLSEKAKQTDLAQLSNPNLLINGDFQVWQRGTSFNQTVTGSLYCADRWQFVKGGNVANFSVNKVAGGVKVTNTSSDGVAMYMEQTIEVPESLQGKKITLSYEGDLVISKVYFNSTVRSGIGGQDLGSSDVNSSTKTITTTIPVGTKALTVILSSTKNEFTINRVKLELGSIVTPFIPRLTSEEKALCERYYKRITSASSSDVPLGSGIFSVNNTLFGLFKTSVPMRITPTLSYSNIGSLEAWGWVGTGMLHSPLTNLYLYAADADNTNISFSANTTSTSFTVGYTANLQITRNTNGWAALDAEIY